MTDSCKAPRRVLLRYVAVDREIHIGLDVFEVVYEGFHGSNVIHGKRLKFADVVFVRWFYPRFLERGATLTDVCVWFERDDPGAGHSSGFGSSGGGENRRQSEEDVQKRPHDDRAMRRWVREKVKLPRFFISRNEGYKLDHIR